MLKRIIDVSQIDIKNPDVRNGLDTDLRRMDKLNHSAPTGANAYRATVTNGIYNLTLCFKLQYGFLEKEIFTPIGQPVRYNTETLPFLD